MISPQMTEDRVLQSIGDAIVIHLTTVVEMCHIFVLSNTLRIFHLSNLCTIKDKQAVSASLEVRA